MAELPDLTNPTEPYAADVGDIGILLIHGFTGSPASMIPWAEALASDGYTVRVPRLPGHGTSPQHLNKVPWQRWYQTVEAALLELDSKCSAVFVAGLSMGGALSLRLAQQHPEIVRGLVLVNPAVNLDRRILTFLPVLKHVGMLPGITNDIRKLDTDEHGYDLLPLHALASQLELWKDVRTNLGRVNAPLLLFRSVTDHVLDDSSVRIITEGVSSTSVELVELLDSYHVATLDHDAPLIFERSATFIDQHVEHRVSEGT